MKITIDLADGDWINCQKIVNALSKIKSDTTPWACLTVSLDGKDNVNYKKCEAGKPTTLAVG